MNSTSNNLANAILTMLAVATVLVFAGVTSHAQTVAFTGATIETMGEEGRLENATMVVSDGKITEVGTDVEIPDDARLVSMLSLIHI